MIGLIKYLWGCDWSKEYDISDSCQVLRQHESEILNNLDQRFSFLLALLSSRQEPGSIFGIPIILTLVFTS